MARKAFLTLALLALSCGAVAFARWMLVEPPVVPPRSSQRDPTPLPHDFYDRVPVALNRGPEILDGFRGNVHPALSRRAALEVAARWEFERNQGDDPAFIRLAPPAARAMFLTLGVTTPTRTYTGRDLSRFLPAKQLGPVGQMWALDSDMVAELLRQFFPTPSMRLVAKGRRAGPDGAFAILRAVSPTHLDILFRVHAEFDVLPDYLKTGSPLPEAWYSPGYFVGRMVIDREAKKVASFRLGLPPEDVYNVHVSVASGSAGSEYHGWMRVDRMELTAGDEAAADKIPWADEIAKGEALDRLAKVFYKFKEIDWLPFDRTQAAANARKKPIFVVVALGTLDNQTC